jgi:hypothetical protein
MELGVAMGGAEMGGAEVGGAEVGWAGPGETGGANGDSNVLGSVGNCGCSADGWDAGGIHVEGGANGDCVLGGAEAGEVAPAGSAVGVVASSGSPSSCGVRGGVMRRGAAGQGGWNCPSWCVLPS